VVRFLDFVHTKNAIGGVRANPELMRDIICLQKFRSDKYYLRKNELEQYMPMLRNENEWLASTYSDDFFDENIELFSSGIDHSGFKNFVDSSSSELSPFTKNMLVKYFKIPVQAM
jgi:hypothetical protein